MTQPFNFIEAEETIMQLWKKHDTFNQSDHLAKDRPSYTFFDGPPFATGLPHYGHILASTIKDTIGRFFYQQGFSVERRFGWDCHGLPVEYEIDKRENINSREEIIEMGIAKYNDMCRSIVDVYTKEWQFIIERLGRWVSFDNGYKTMDTTFMESVWYIFCQLFDKGMVYRGYRVMPFSTACSTPLSNFEANQNYKEVSDPSILFKIQLEEKICDLTVSLVVWTTTPWTLPSNCALAVNKEFEYVIVECDETFLVLLKNRIDEYFFVEEDNLEKKLSNIEIKDSKKRKVKFIKVVKGEELIGKSYKPIFDYFIHLKEKNFFKVINGDFIDADAGTGIVHCAPGFGEEDYNCFVANKLIIENEEVPCPIDDKGRYTKEVSDYIGRYVKDCDKDIIKNLKDKAILISNTSIVHRYPFCWRSDTPLLYKVVPNWFVKVKGHIKEMLENNEKISWVPESVKYKKFHNWLENARDWSISRNRFWGTPIPIWADKEYKNFICVKSIEDLENLSGVKIFYNKNNSYIDLNHKDICNHSDDTKNEMNINNNKCDKECNGPSCLGNDNCCVNNHNKNINDCFNENINIKMNDKYKQTDIHREFIDNIKIIKDGIEYHRVDEVLDCWFESGSMPYAQNHYPFSNDKLIIPADFIGEGVDQTRGWFYTLHVISTILFNEPAFKNVIVNGIVLAEDGRKMSKRLKNYPDVMEIIHKYGSDSLRLSLLSSPVTVGENLRFVEGRVKDIYKMLLIPWYNVVNFYLDSKKGDEILSMDNWIENRFNNLLFNINKDVQKYNLSNLLPYILEFIDDLSNWYIRMNRKEIRNGCTKQLELILNNFSILMAPFMPFFSEYTFQLLKNNTNENNTNKNNTNENNSNENNSNKTATLNENNDANVFCSVHFEMYPKLKTVTIHPFDKIKEILMGIRSLRESIKISLKTPLRNCHIICDTEMRLLIEEYKNVIKNECNLINIEFNEEKNYDFKESWKPNFSTIIDNKKEKIALIRNLNNEEIKKLVKEKEIVKNNINISFNEIFYKKELFGNVGEYKSFNNFSLILNTKIDDELLEMRDAREFNSFLQKMRKNAGLKMEEKRNVFISDLEFKKIIEKYYNLDILENKEGEVEVVETFILSEKTIKVYLFK
ncbi:hypothetical protein COBT_000324 [Conglomerata obtusa]